MSDFRYWFHFENIIKLKRRKQAVLRDSIAISLYKGNKVQAMLYDNEIGILDEKLKLHHTYNISNASVKAAMEFTNLPDPNYGNLWNITRRTVIREVVAGDEININQDHQPHNSILEILCMLVISTTDKSKPVTMTLWGNFAMTEGIQIDLQLSQGKFLIIFAQGVNVNAFQGITLSTRYDTTIEEANNLSVISKTIVDKTYLDSFLTLSNPLQQPICTFVEIADALKETPVAWVRGKLRMKNIGPIEYYIGCNYCNKGVKDIEGLKLDCLYCGQTDGITVKRYRLNVEISDGSTILQATLFNHDVHRLMLLFGIEMPTTVKESEIFQQKLDSTDFVVGLRKNALNEDQSFSLTYSVACICKAITRDNCVQQQTPHACSSNIVEETFLVGNLTKRMLDLDGSLKHAIDIIEDDTSEQKSASQDKDHVPSPSHSDLISSLDFEDTSFWNELNLDSLLEIENELYKLLQPSIEAEPAVQYDPLVKVVEGVLSEPLSGIVIEKEKKNRVKRTFCDSKTVTKQMISSHFHLPVSKAAEELKLGVTTLKLRCRELGIRRWPREKLLKLEDEDEQEIPFSSPDQDYRESSHENEPVCDFHQEIHHDLEFMNVMIGEHYDVATEAPSNVKEVSKSGETIIVDKRTSKPWSFDTISPLFHLPASQAAKELNMANHVSSSVFTDETVYPSSDASEYPFWDVQCEQFPWTSFNAINNYEPLLNMDFDPFWNFEHNLEPLDPLRMDGIFLPSTSVIPIEGDITPNSNAVAVEQDTTTGTKESMIEKIVRKQGKRTKKTFRDPSTITKAMLSTYFHMPIYKAAKELGIEYRILKRRELDGANFPTFTYPLSANECNNRLIPLPSGEYECTKCLTNWTKGIDKYNLKLQVEDANGNAKLKLVDKDCIQLIGKTASDLRAKYRRITPQLPEEIQSLVGLAMLFMVEVKREQLENRYAPFSVTKLSVPAATAAEQHAERLPTAEVDYRAGRRASAIAHWAANNLNFCRVAIFFDPSYVPLFTIAI
nr:replication protein A 70 kDa DNA-binding subunit B-like [Ipomoea batatas]